MPKFNIVDIVTALFILLGALRGLRRGLSGELAKLTSVVIAVWAGWRFYQPLGELIFRSTRLTEQQSYALAFFAALAGAFLFMLVARLVIRQVMEFTFKGKVERVGGALSGLVRAVAVATAVILFMSLVPNAYLHSLFVEDSLVGRALYNYLPTIYEDLSERYPRLPHLWDPSGAATNRAPAGAAAGPQRE